MGIDEILCEPDCASGPVGLAGCRAQDSGSFDACAYDVVVFDGDTSGRHNRLASHDGKTVAIWHASLSESDSGSLLKYGQMRVLRDDSWDLRSLIRRVAARRDALYRDCARNSILQSMFCCQKVRELCSTNHSINAAIHDSKNSESTDYACILGSCWQKCASIHLAKAICAINNKLPGPSHVLDVLRNLPKTRANSHLSVITDTIGMERATSTLLGRMSHSAAGLAEYANALCHNDIELTDISTILEAVGAGASDTGPIITNDNDAAPSWGMPSRLLLEKHDFFVSESLMTDCYFYLAHASMRAMSAASDMLYCTPGLGRILRVAFDAQGDLHLSVQNADDIYDSCRRLLSAV